MPYGRKLFRIDKFLHFQFAVGSGRHCITAEKAAAEISRIIESDFIGDLRDVQRTGPEQFRRMTDPDPVQGVRNGFIEIIPVESPQLVRIALQFFREERSGKRFAEPQEQSFPEMLHQRRQFFCRTVFPGFPAGFVENELYQHVQSLLIFRRIFLKGKKKLEIFT